MKKLCAVCLVMFMLLSCAFAESVDLPSMSYDELQRLQQRINAEIISRPEWREVEVPAGMWIVGEEIPAGKYSISHVGKKTRGSLVVWGAAKNDYLTNSGKLFEFWFSETNPLVGRLDLKDGNLVEFDIPLIFSPVKGLGF